MRLYKMELYKLCHKKIFIIGTVCVIGILLFYFSILVSDEYTCINGISYHGYQAVWMDRQITEEFKGILTDEKVERIIEKYGFPKEVEKYNKFFADGNFLNRFVVQYLSDGFYWNFDNYQIATCIYPIADTELGEAGRVIGEDIILEYNDGWITFVNIIETGMILGSILILFSISTVFANERQVEMLPLLFTTKEGKRKDIYAKIAAVFTIGIGVCMGIILLDFLLCGVVYGFRNGWNCLLGTILMLSDVNVYYRPITVLPISSYISIVLFCCLLGVLLLCAVTIYISACFRSSFHAVVSAAIYWCSPILVWALLMNFRFIPYQIRIFLYTSPMYLAMPKALFDIYSRWYVFVGIAGVEFLVCTVGAYWKYKFWKG